MKKTLAFLILILLNINTYSSWHSIEPRVTDKPLFAICFPDSLHGWAVGGDGAIIKTSNGGNSWIVQASQATDTLKKVFFIDSLNGWAVGYHGCVVKTNNGGAIWTKLLKRTDQPLIGVYFSSRDTGIVISQGQNETVIKTTDNGSTWTNYPLARTDYILTPNNDVSILSLNKIWIATYYGNVSRTCNGGLSWNNSRPASWIGMVNLKNIHLFNDTVGLVYKYDDGYNLSIDSGNNWRVMGNPSRARLNNGDVVVKPAFVNIAEGYAPVSGSQNYLIKTIDTCKTWQIDSSFAFASEYLNGIFFDRSNNGWIVGSFGAVYSNKPSLSNASLIAGGLRSNKHRIIQKIVGHNLSINSEVAISSLSVYSIQGKKQDIFTITSFNYGCNPYLVECNISQFPSGAYVVKIATVDNKITSTVFFKK